MVDQHIEITPIEAKWILENIDIAYNEGQGSESLSDADADAFLLRLADLAGVDRGEYWWLERIAEAKS